MPTLLSARDVESLVARWTAHPGPRFLALDFDGTLAPIVENPELAAVPAPHLAAFRTLSHHHETVVVSGRSRADLLRRLPPGSRVRAWGSHGFEPDELATWSSPMPEPSQQLAAVLSCLRERLADQPHLERHLRIEQKRFSLVLHYRSTPVEPEAVLQIGREACAESPAAWRCEPGRQIVELRPDTDWGKGPALLAEFRTRSLLQQGAHIFCAGDDVTDESAFVALAGLIERERLPPQRVTTVLVADVDRESAAQHRLRNPDELHRLLGRLGRPA